MPETQLSSAKPHRGPVLYGGQAIIEGVMIRGRTHAAIALRKSSGRLVRHALPIQGWANSGARRLPLVRGVIVLAETLVMGMKALTISANEAADEETAAEAVAGADGAAAGPRESAGQAVDAMGRGAMAGMLGIAILFAVAIFFLAPLFLSRAVESAGASGLTANIAEGAIRLGLFVGYVWLIGRMSDIQRVYGYHGAEHMAVAANESGAPLTVESVRRFSPAHPRCGTSFLLTVVFVSILLFIFIPREPMWLLVGSRIVLIPVIAAVSYEFIRFSGTRQDNPLVRLASMPNLLLQKLTTRQPDDSMIEVAIDAMEYALELDGVREPSASVRVAP